MLAGELYKLSRNRLVWLLSVVLVGFLAAPYLIYLGGRGIKQNLATDPLSTLYLIMQRDLQVLRIFSGIYLLLLAALAVGQEYSQGTIRVLLGRGAGRLHLLGAKALALAAVAVGLLAFALALDVVLALGFLLVEHGNLDALQAATPRFWGDTRLYIASVAISMGATLLLGLAASALGRSLAAGLTVGLAWFPVDNLSVLVLSLLTTFTHSDFWVNVSAYLLGPTLNTLPALIVPARVMVTQGPKGPVTMSQAASTLGAPVLVPVDGAHALLVVLGYSLVFAALAVIVTWRRDVLE
jgi:ABC-type transport system involved in multi-copper enzyme maturation permease subunit